MKIKAITPWFGSKRNLANDIVQEFGNHKAYWEVFCGSLAVLFGKPRCSMETVNDLHGDLINLIRTVQHDQHGPALYRKLRRTVMSADQFEESAKVVQGQPCNSSPTRAFHFFVYCWMGRNGESGTTKTHNAMCKRYANTGGHAATRFAGVVDSIPSFRERMRNLTVLQDDAFELLGRIEDASEVVIYCDPPYVEKGARYLHDFTQKDHARLAEALARFEKTRVVVSYYKHPLVEELYKGWTRRELDATKAMVNQTEHRGKGVVKAPEILLINGESYVEKQGGCSSEKSPYRKRV